MDAENLISLMRTKKNITDQWVERYQILGAGLEERQRSLLPGRDGFYVPDHVRWWISETVDAERLKADIREKRSKDLLMSLGLIPLPKEHDAREYELLERYQFIERFREESRQFGAARQTKEQKAADLALQNLSGNAGFSDVSRLTLRMEVRLSEETERYLEWLELDEHTRIRAEVDQQGKARLVCEKNGKLLKSLPPEWKKDERTAAHQKMVKHLKEQYSRAYRMLEDAMTDRTVFSIWELRELRKSPVIRPIIDSLVFGAADRPEGRPFQTMGFLSDQGLMDERGTVTALGETANLAVMHPYDLYQADRWYGFRQYLTEHQISQPFQQVFRAFYRKLDAELDKEETRMFAGKQFQQGKTDAILRGRRWGLDHHGCLQKIDHKAHIAARIDHSPDWFVLSGIEGPSLESVAFVHRDDRSPLRIRDVPDILYSEVMRDVGLAVSDGKGIGWAE